MTGDFETGIAAQDEARELWRELNNLPMLADNLTSSGYVNFEFGNYEVARAYAEEAKRIAQSIGNLWGQAYSGSILGSIYLELGEFSMAFETMTEAERLSAEANFLGSKIILPGLQAWGNAFLGDYDASREAIKRALVDADDAQVFKARILAADAWWHYLNGDLEQANELMEQASAGLKVETPDLFIGSLIQSIELDIDLANKKIEIALEKAEKYLALTAKDGRRLFRADLLLRKGMALLELGDSQEAWSVFEEARLEAQTLGSQRALLPILATMYPIALERGDQEEVASIRKQGAELIEYLKGKIEDPALLEKFLQTPNAKVFLD